MGIYCIYPKCKNRKNSPKLEKGVFFLPFPKPSRDMNRCEKWVKALNRIDIKYPADVKSYHFVCSKHFIGGNGPTSEYTEPIPYEERLEENYILPVVNESLPENKPNLQGSVVLDNYNTLEGVGANESGVSVKVEKGNAYIADSAEEEEYLNNSRKLTQVVSKECKQEITPDLEELVKVESNLSQEMLKTIEHPEVRVHTDYLFTLKNLAASYLMHNARNVDSIDWFYEKLPNTNYVSFKKVIGKSFLRIEVSSNLEVAIQPCNEILKNNHAVYTHQDLQNISTVKLSCLYDLLTLMTILDCWTVCQGITGDLYSTFRNKTLVSANVSDITESIRSSHCEYLFDEDKKLDKCKACRLKKQILQRRIQRESKKRKSSMKKNLRFMNEIEIKERFGQYISKIRGLKERVKRLETKIGKS